MLWPYLLEMLIPEEYSNSTGAVCCSLAHLAQKKRDENAEDFVSRSQVYWNKLQLKIDSYPLFFKHCMVATYMKKVKHKRLCVTDTDLKEVK